MTRETDTGRRSSGTAAGRILVAATLLFGLSGQGRAASGLPEACLEGRKTPFEPVRLAGPDAHGDFVDRAGRLYGLADLVTLVAGDPAVTERTLSFHDIVGSPDRWNRRSGLIVDPEGGAWLARALVTEGRAAVLPEHLPPNCLAPLLAAEEVARRAGRGGWRVLHVHSATDAAGIAGRSGRFALVSGRVRSVGVTRSTLYLNFGPRWRDDFTVTISAEKREEFRAAGLDVAALEGAAIRIRGIVQMMDGPVISVSHPAQIERLDKDGTRR